jgi:hypothetical protein
MASVSEGRLRIVESPAATCPRRHAMALRAYDRAHHGLPPRMRRLLHCTIDQQRDTRNARRQACGPRLRATRQRAALPTLRQSRTSRGVRQPAPCAGNVRRRPAGGDAKAATAGSADRAAGAQWPLTRSGGVRHRDPARRARRRLPRGQAMSGRRPTGQMVAHRHARRFALLATSPARRAKPGGHSGAALKRSGPMSIGPPRTRRGQSRAGRRNWG